MRSGYTGLGRALVPLTLAVCLQSCDFRSGSAGDTRLTSLDPGDCSLVTAAGDHDALSYRCDGPDRPVFLHFNDGTRLSIQIGMGGPEFGPFSSKREPNWPLQWVGKTDMGGFKPTAAIFRAREPYDDEGPTFLTVVSLASTPCVLGRTSGPNANEQAMSLAENGRCGEESSARSGSGGADLPPPKVAPQSVDRTVTFSCTFRSQRNPLAFCLAGGIDEDDGSISVTADNRQTVYSVDRMNVDGYDLRVSLGAEPFEITAWGTQDRVLRAEVRTSDGTLLASRETEGGRIRMSDADLR